MLHRFVVLFCFVSVAFGDPLIAKIDKLIDQAISNSSGGMNKIYLPDRDLRFSIPYTWSKAGIHIKDFAVRGLENIQRIGEIQVNVKGKYQREITVLMGAEDIQMSGKADFWFAIPISRAHLSGNVDSIAVKVGLLNDKKSLKIEYVRVTLNGFVIKIDTPGFIVDALVNAGLRVTRFAYSPAIKSLIRGAVLTLMEDVVKEFEKQA